MLETELNNEKSEPGEQGSAGSAEPVAAAAADTAGTQPAAKAPKTRRTTRVTRAAGPPSPSALTAPSVPAVPVAQDSAPAASATPGRIPVVPDNGPPVGTPLEGVRGPIHQTGFSAPEPPNPVTQPAFLAPQLIFQPPEAVPASTVRAAGRSGGTSKKPASSAAGGDDSAAPQADGDDADGGADAGSDPAGDDPDDRPRRRRGSRGKAKGKAGETGEEAGQEPDEAAAADGGGHASADAAPDGDADAEDDEDSADGPARRRRRRRRRGGAADADQPAPDDPPETVVHVREPRTSSRVKVTKDEVQGLKGSTRLEAKKQRRREGRETGRRRPPVITESEFLARREAVDRVMVVRQRGEHTQIAVMEDDVLVEHYVDKTSHQSFVGNVYLGKVQNVLPSMEAAFVDVGKGRNAVLYAGEVNFDASGLEGQTRRIESALKSGQSVLVQVTKDPVGHKGARLTSQVSLPGRYLVYVPGASMMGISRKLPDTERTRLKQILKKVMPEDAGVIVRTAAEGATEEELSQDVSRLSAQWENIERKSKTASPPELLYSEPDLTIRVVRDIFNEDFSRLVVSGDDGWDMVDEYVHYVAPHLLDRLSRWQDEGDVFASHRIDEQLAKAMDRKVWLPSGGSLVIDKTEAMTVVDVNTGKFTGQGGNLEETVTRNNLEAAEEIVRQLRLRDIGGIIVIDFIDMVLESNRDLVLRRLLECLARDRTKHQVAEVTSLGLVQMTRKRVGAGLLEAFSVPCDCCNGRGVIVSLEPDELATSATTQRRKDEHAGSDGDGAKSPAAAEDKPAGSSRRRRRKPAAAAAVAGNGSAAEAVAAIASASAETALATGTAEPQPNGKAEPVNAQESSTSEIVAE
jgi:ribonuclease E